MPLSSRHFTRRLHVAIGRTFAKGTYTFAPNGDYSAWALIEKGIKQATRWIYLEDQYLVSRMARQALLAKLRDPSFEYLLMVMNGSGAAAADFKFLVTARNEFRRDLLSIDPKRERWGMYTLKQATDPERQKWCGNYVHSKTWVFDDGYVIMGSANCDNRGYTLDTEVVAGIADSNLIDVRIGESFASDLRTTLWHKHLGIPHALLRDWDKGIRFWRSPPPSAMIQDASAYEPDNDLTPPSNFPSAADAKNIELAWTRVIDPDAR
jgi:phosphatidylserine/phosphatidylglycerophosphate/cardiolipin synthase-like enzyme